MREAREFSREEIEYRGLRLIPENTGWVVQISRKMRLPGVYTGYLMATKAADKHLALVASRKHKDD